MNIDVFTEVQKRDCDRKGGFRQLFDETIEQARVADQAGFDCWWQVEHHCSADFSYSSCPEMILEAIALATKRLRIGHSGILSSNHINQWMRSAERSAFLDQISDGRLEVGLAKGSGREWETFLTGEEQARNDFLELTRLLPHAWTESPFSWEGKTWRCADRDIQPKPVQKPHPPLWHTGTSPSSWVQAGSMGVGMLCTTLFTPLEVLEGMIRSYREAIARCDDPAGQFINDSTGVFTFVFVADSQKAAIESGAPRGALWYASSVPRVFGISREAFFTSLRGNFDPRSRLSWEQVNEAPLTDSEVGDENAAVALVKRELAGQELTNEEIFETIGNVDSVIIGDVATCRKKMEKFRDIGFDRLLCMSQMGDVPHELIVENLWRIGHEIIPHFRESRATSVSVA